MLLAAQVVAGAAAFIVMIILSRNALIVELKRQFCRSERLKALLRAG
jgi:lipopolysaccharide exporter